MRSLAQVAMAVAVFFAGLCPAWCLTVATAGEQSHACCHGKKHSTQPCGQASAPAQALPQASVAPVVPALVTRQFVVRMALPVFDLAAAYAVQAAGPPGPRIVTVLRI